MVKYFEQSFMARKNVSRLWFSLLVPKSRVLPHTRCRDDIEKGVLTLPQKPLWLRLKLSVF